jgi:hypothetical protein
MSSTLSQPDVLIVALVANSVVLIIQHEETELPATIVLEQPLAGVELSTGWPCLHLLAVLTSSTLATTSHVDRHFDASFFLFVPERLPASAPQQTAQPTRCGR